MADDNSYQEIIHRRHGGAMLVIPTGCTGVVESGGVFNVESGGKFVMDDGSSMTFSGDVNFASGSTFNVASGAKLNLASGSTMTVNAPVNYASGSSMNIASGASLNIASGANLQIGGTNYISTDGKIVQQYESKTSANDGGLLTNYGVSFLSPVIVASTFVLPAGTAYVEKRIILENGATSTSAMAAVTIKSSACTIVDSSSSTAITTITSAAYQSGSIHLVAKSTAQWHVIGKPSTSFTLA